MKKNKLDNLIPFQKGFDPRRNINGAARKLISTFTEIGYTKREASDTYLNLAAMTIEELKHIEANQSCTVLERTIAKALLKGYEKGSLYNLETTLSRAIGTPNQSSDVTVDNKIEVVFVKGKTIL